MWPFGVGRRFQKAPPSAHNLHSEVFSSIKVQFDTENLWIIGKVT